MTPKVFIIILNWNGLNDTTECLASLKKNYYRNIEIIIVDNASDGNDVKLIENRYNDFIHKIIINDSNLGFSGGNNVGIKYAIKNGADYILLLNNDTIVEPDFLSQLVKADQANPEASILTPRINYYNRKDIIWFAGGYISKLRASGFPEGIGEHEIKYHKDRYCNFASGCCMLIKRDVIETIGFLDENYFLYLEDSDYSYRAHKEGFKIYYASASKIYHKVSSTTSRTNELLPLYYMTRNRLYFAKKNFGNHYFFIIVLFMMVTFPIKLIFFKNKIKTLKTLVKAFSDMSKGNMGKGSF